MSKRSLAISILSSVHEPMDERIFLHFARTLKDAGHFVSIICSSKEQIGHDEGIRFDSFESSKNSILSKIKLFYDRLVKYQPAIIICQEPLPIIAAYYYKRKTASKVKIVYDITEWQPSFTQLIYTRNAILKIGKGIGIAFFNLFSASLTDAFIFGETSKQFPYRSLFPFKKSILISYYPDRLFFKTPSQKKRVERQEWVLGYTGTLNKERGIFHFLDTVLLFHQKHPHFRIRLMLIGSFEHSDDQNLFERSILQLPNVSLLHYPWLSFLEFCQKIEEMDICLDLRTVSLERDNSLPIKLFYYMACAKPMIFSDLKAIRKDVPEIIEFGYLVDPKKSVQSLHALEHYFFDPLLYEKHSEAALYYFNTEYNWGKLSPLLEDFIEHLANG